MTPNSSVFAFTLRARVKISTISSDDAEKENIESRTELDPHDNMVVVGKHSHVLNYNVQTAQVGPFTSTYNALENVPIVDAAITHDCEMTVKTYLLICHNALLINSMDHNLIPPFIMQEANVVVNEVPKIQSTDPDVTHHSIWFPESRFRIPLSLRGILLYFVLRMPKRDELLSSEVVLMLTP